MTMSDKRKGFFHYLFTTALEGGIGYWSNCQEYHWSKSDESAVIQIQSSGEWKKTKVRTEDLDGFYAVIVSSEDDWGVAVAYQPSNSSSLVVRSTSSEYKQLGENTPLRIDLKVMEKGWNMFMDLVIIAAKEEDPKVSFSNPYFKKAVVQYLTDMEDGESDSDVADLVVQLGLFGEHVYS
jgi:hypothetical protein